MLPTRLLDISLNQDSSIFLVYTRNLSVSSDVPLYATLSHCWGKKQFIKTVSSNVDSFQKCIPFEGLPRTFQDAISIARELGIKYIWIDSLCIIQDSIADWKHESALMASVYSNSYLNIAATGSSDSSRAFLTSRDLTHKCVPIPNKFPADGIGGEEPEIFVRASLNRVHKLYSTPGRTLPWSPDEGGNFEAPLLSRAWVFQERYLAPRTLHFHQSELVMECRAGLRCECSGLDHFTSNPLRDVNDMSFTSWFWVVEEFSRLNLTHQSDRLEALMGVAKVFWERLGCSYLHGVWENDIAKGLLWNVTRSVLYGTTPSKCARQEKNVAPTWSWASLVIPEGSRIYFPAGEGETFRSDERFDFLGTDTSTDSLQSLFRNDSGAILVKGGFVEATACFVVGEEHSEPDAVLIFQEDLDDAVLITVLNWSTDVLPNLEDQLGEISWDVDCLLLGSAEERDEDTDESVTFNHMLVLRASSDTSGAWERVGILNTEEEVGSPWVFEEKIFRLV